MHSEGNPKFEDTFMQIPLYLMFVQEYIRHFVKTSLRVVAYFRHFAFVRHFLTSPTIYSTALVEQSLSISLKKFKTSCIKQTRGTVVMLRAKTNYEPKINH